MSLACSMIRVISGSHHFLEETGNAYLLQLGQSTHTLFEDPQRTRNLSLLLVDRSVTQKLHGIAHAIILLHSSPQSTACSVCILPLPYLCEQRSIERLLSKRSASTLITSLSTLKNCLRRSTVFFISLFFSNSISIPCDSKTIDHFLIQHPHSTAFPIRSFKQYS